MYKGSDELVFKLLKTPIVHDIPLGGSSGVFNQVLESEEVHDKVKFVLAEVYSSYSLKDHFVFWFTADTCDSSQVGWAKNGLKFNPNFRRNLQKVCHSKHHV